MDDEYVVSVDRVDPQRVTVGVDVARQLGGSIIGEPAVPFPFDVGQFGKQIAVEFLIGTKELRHPIKGGGYVLVSFPAARPRTEFAIDKGLA